MEYRYASNGNGDPIFLDHFKRDFKVSIVGVAADGFDGQWTVQFSPNGEDWIDHEEMHNLTGDKVGNLYFQIPYIRVKIEGRATGLLKFYVFGE